MIDNILILYYSSYIILNERMITVFCNNCGKELPDGSKFCNYCGASMPEAKPKHIRPEGKPRYVDSRYTENGDTEYDVVNERIAQPAVDDLENGAVSDETKVYNFSNFEESADKKAVDDEKSSDAAREDVGDSFDNYSDEDDMTFMDKVDSKFRRDDDRPDKKRNLTWLWVSLGIIVVILVVVIAIVAFSSGKSGRMPGERNTTSSAMSAR